MQVNRDQIRAAGKVLTVAAIFALAPLAWAEPIARRASQLYFDDRLNQLFRFSVLITLMFAGIGVAAFLKDRRWRVALAVIFGAGFWADQVAQAVTGQPMSIELMQLLWSERAMAPEAAAAYILPAIKMLVVVVPLFGLLASAPPMHLALSARYAAIPLLCFILAPVNIFITTHKIDEYPSTYGPYAQLIYVVFGKQYYAGPRDEVTYSGALHPAAEKIVYIVDESVRSDYLQINNPQFDNTPYLAAHANEYANFGTAISAANASGSTRLVLRTGLKIDQMPDATQISLHNATLWQFAKRAGMRTVYIDAWRPDGETHSFMNRVEMQSIDQRINIHDGAKSLVDKRVADRLADELAVPGPVFIFVEKIGSHVPYASTVAADDLYEPSGVDQLPAAQNATHRSVIRDYLRSTRNGVDAFLERLMPGLRQKGVFAIYTSDHGQALFEGGYENSHGSIVNVHPGEARVPILVFSGDDDTQHRFAAAAVAFHDHASHFDLFPTLLWVMGFEKAWISGYYGSSLLDIPPNRHRKFLCGNIFGGKKTNLSVAD